MGRAWLKSLLGFFLILSIQAETPHTQKEEPPKDNLNLPDDERRKIILENLLTINKKFNQLPESDKSKPIARTESPKVEKKIEDKAAAETKNQWVADIPFTTTEVANFSAIDAQRAIQTVIQKDQLSENFLDFTKRYRDLESTVSALTNAGMMRDIERPKTVTTGQTAALVLEEDPARFLYLAAAYKFHNDMMNKTETRNIASEALNAQQASGAALGSSMAGYLGPSTPIVPHTTLATPDLASLANGYMDIAAKQIVNAGNARPTDNATGLSSPFEGSTPLNKLFTNALNTANSFDVGNKSLAEQIKPFKDLISSKEFLENGALLLGKGNADALVSAVQAADLLKEADGKVTAPAADYLSGAFNLGTGIASPPCIGCAELKNSPLAKQAQEYAPAEDTLSEDTQKWIDEAKEISNQANRNRTFNPKQIAALVKGRNELEKLMQELAMYKSLGLLNLVQVPSTTSMSKHYKDAAETAAAILFSVREKKIKNTAIYSIRLNHQKIKDSAGALLEKMKDAKNPSSMEIVLRGFFEKEENDEARSLWRSHEALNYKKLRSLTAQILLARSMAALKLPSFEIVTIERASLGYLVNKAFANLREREERLLKEKQRNLGILKLPEIKMADEKKEKVAPKKEPERYPSFSEE